MSVSPSPSALVSPATRVFSEAAAGLPERLRRETASLHAEAERAALMSALMRGHLPREGYLALMRDLRLVYAVLESLLAQHAAEPAIAALDWPALARLATIEADLRALGDVPTPDAGSRAGVQARAYADHLRTMAATRPLGLVAHAYVRYLGDLSGGQMIAPVVRSRYAANATAFYDFGGDDRVQALKRRFRSALGTLPVDAHGAEAIVQEARAAFERHRRLFDELAARWLPDAAAPVA